MKQMFFKNKKTIDFKQSELQRYHVELARAEAQIKKKILTTRTRRNSSEMLRFVITASVIFTVAFVGLNFSAYKKQMTFWIKNIRADILADTTLPKQAQSIPIKLSPKEKTFSSDFIYKELPPLVAQVSPPDNRIIIPCIEVHAPIREAKDSNPNFNDWNMIEGQIQNALQDGVVHFPGTVYPGERGNAFLTGHSSYYPWDSGHYKDVFALLPQIEIGDKIFIWQNQKKYAYRVNNKKEVSPEKVEVLDPTDDYRLTLMTCTPIGTTLRRLIVTAQLLESS